MVFTQHCSVRSALGASLLAAALPASGTATDTTDFSQLSLKDLVALEVFTAASLVPTEASKAPGTVYSFDRADFQAFGVRRLDDLLAFVPGLQLSQHRKRHRAIWARGQLDRFNDKMVLLVDGVRRRHLYYGHFAVGDNLPLEQIETVEVILGPASSLYGANAFAGIISVTTRNFAGQPVLEATQALADNDRSKTTILYNSQRLQVFGSYLEQDAPFRDERRSFIGGTVLQPLDENYQTLSVKATPLEGLTLGADYTESKTPYLFIPDTQDAFVDEQFLNLQLGWARGELESGRLEASAYYQRDKAREYEKEQLTRALGYSENQNAEMAGATATALRRWGAHTLASGVSWQREAATETDFSRYYHFRDGFLDPPIRGDLLSEPGIVNEDSALFVQDVWALDPRLSLTLGARYDQFEQFDDYVNYRSALVYTPAPRQTWKLQYGTAIRTPTFREYLKVLEGTRFVAPPVDPEKSRMLELGYQYQWDEASLGLNIFRSALEGYIHAMPTPDGEDEYFTNSNETYYLRGAEALLNLRPVSAVDVRLAVAYQGFEDPGFDIPYLASWTGSLQTEYRYSERHAVGLTLSHSDNRPDTNSYPGDDARAFTLVNVFVRGQVAKDLDYRAGIDNVFNRRVYDPAADFGGQYNTERTLREIWLQLTWTVDFL